jgi:hypothetical protein
LNKYYHCLLESGLATENECDLYTLIEVVEFCKSLAGYDLTIEDYESLIQVGKVEKITHKKERLLITINDLGRGK